MDTPEKTQIANPISKFEDSPVFNYINGLSPIKPAKSIHVTEAFSSLTFASLPPIFASPQVNSHKESRFLKGHRDLDLENTKDQSENESKPVAVNIVNHTSRQKENVKELPGNFVESINVGETSVDPVDESFEFVIELPQALKYNCGSPDCELSSTKRNGECVTQQPDGSHLQQHSENHYSENKGDAEGISGQKAEEMQFAMDGSDSKSTDILIFSSPNDAIAFRGLIQTSPDISASLLASRVSNAAQYKICTASEKRQLFHHFTSGEQYETEGPSFLPSESHFPEDIVQTEMDECLNNGEGTDAKALVPVDLKMSPDLHRGMRRRCLDFEAAQPLRKDSDSSLAVQEVTDNKASNDKPLILVKQGVGSSKSRILPGIGLHLNALTSSSRTFNHETVLPDASSQLSISYQENLNPVTSENEMDPAVNGLQLTEYDPTRASMNYEEINQLSPRKRRRRDLGVEPESCKRCNCKKSKCLKLYCECFAAGVYCIEPCACQDCLNKPIHEETVLATRKQIESRNPLAFAPKVIRSSDSASEMGDEPNKTPASARHKRGCNCKKSNCLKKYCECYQGGVGCSFNCRCEGCKNAIGTKNGVTIAGPDCEMEEDSEEKCEKSVVDRIAWTTDNQKIMEQNDSCLLSTPSELNRPVLPMGFPLKTKQLRSSLLNVGPSFSIRPNQRMGGSRLLGLASKFKKLPLQTNPEDEIPGILYGSTPTVGLIKATSPNSKRVSPPHTSSFGFSPCQRSGGSQRSGGRRLILQSIPAFPSLNLHD